MLETMAISAIVSFKDDGLLIMIEAEDTPEQSAVVTLLHKEIKVLEIRDVCHLKLYGRKTGDTFPDWESLVDLVSMKPDVGPNYDNSEDNFQEEEILSTQLPVLTQALCGIELSNQLYEVFQTTCYGSLAYRINREKEKTIHSMVKDFVDELDNDLHSDIELLIERSTQVCITYGINIDIGIIHEAIFSIVKSNFSTVQYAIRNLEHVTRDVLNTEFPSEPDELKAFFSGAAREFTAQILGTNSMSKEAVIGAAIGSVIAPGLGSVLGGAIGGWIGSQNQQKIFEELLTRYDNSRTQLFQAWENLLELIYDHLARQLKQVTSVHLMSYQTLDQAHTLYKKGNAYLSDVKTLVQAIDYYAQAVQLNPGFVEAWNNQGYAYTQVKSYKDALQSLEQALKINPEFVPAINNYGDALRYSGRTKEALDAYGESIKIETRNTSAWLGMGICLYNLEEYQEAIKASEKLLSLDSSDYPSSWYLQACCYVKMGQHEPAIESLKRSFEIDPDAIHKFASKNPDFDPIREHPQFKILMESRLGVNYALLKEYLKTQQWCKADQETARLMKEIVQRAAGSSEIDTGSLTTVPRVDLKTIDSLWSEMSNGRFGFSIQKRIFKIVAGDRDRFGAEIGWRVQDKDGLWIWRNNNAFDYDFSTAPIGHLPSSLWAGEDTWSQNRRDRLIALFQVLSA